MRGGYRLGVAMVGLAIALGGCGGDDEEPAGAGATGAQGATGPSGGVIEITAEEFLAELLPEKTRAIESVAAATRGCAALAQEVEPSLVLVISDAAANADPETPLVELVEAEC